jgi:hypothetical protein
MQLRRFKRLSAQDSDRRGHWKVLSRRIWTLAGPAYRENGTSAMASGT